MNNNENMEEDKLSGYIKPERIAKAPDGFTEKIMARIQDEPSRARSAWRLRKEKILVPVISVIIILGLMVLATISGANDNPHYLSGIEKILNNITLPSLKIESFSGFNIPVVVIYIIIGLSILSFFDIVLNRFFHRKDY
jgi:hypothetical protein